MRFAPSLLAAACFVALAPGAAQDAPRPKLASGLELGSPIPAYNPTHVAGPDRGTTNCPT